MSKEYIEQREGVYRVIGSRVSLDSIVTAFLEGFSPEAIVNECFPTLSLEQVYGAITFYLANREEVDRYLAAQHEEYEIMRNAAIAKNPELYQRLAQARQQMINK